MRWMSATLVALALAVPALGQTAAGPRTVPAATYSGERDGVVLIDVREPNEWAETSMPAGAIGISISRADFVDAVAKALGGDRSKPVALICRSGTRSLRGAKMLSDAGFTQVTNIGDGMIGRTEVGSGWLAGGLPLQRAATE